MFSLTRLFILVGCPFQSCVPYMLTHQIFCTFMVPFTGERFFWCTKRREGIISGSKVGKLRPREIA